MQKQIEFYFDFYERNGFDLVPLIRNEKTPFEIAWPECEHKNKREWNRKINRD